MDSERIVENQTVIIRNGSITAIGSSDDLIPPQDSQVVSGAGKYLIPGLFDMHIHIEQGRERSLALYIANGVTSVRNMSGSPWHLELSRRIKINEIKGQSFLLPAPTPLEHGSKILLKLPKSLLWNKKRRATIQ
ncbi:MAG: hypothetical protein OEM82_01725 [Acidobacteriota bacterium]|nr:hypothetical protein [Acidobacteriota bacterium]MDH3530335.1 hypothetical protein [Acidobacteriota bacterium]